MILLVFCLWILPYFQILACIPPFHQYESSYPDFLILNYTFTDYFFKELIEFFFHIANLIKVLVTVSEYKSHVSDSQLCGLTAIKVWTFDHFILHTVDLVHNIVETALQLRVTDLFCVTNLSLSRMGDLDGQFPHNGRNIILSGYFFFYNEVDGIHTGLIGFFFIVVPADTDDAFNSCDGGAGKRDSFCDFFSSHAHFLEDLGRITRIELGVCLVLSGHCVFGSIEHPRS